MGGQLTYKLLVSLGQNERQLHPTLDLSDPLSNPYNLLILVVAQKFNQVHGRVRLNPPPCSYPLFLVIRYDMTPPPSLSGQTTRTLLTVFLSNYIQLQFVKQSIFTFKIVCLHSLQSPDIRHKFAKRCDSKGRNCIL